MTTSVRVKTARKAEDHNAKDKPKDPNTKDWWVYILRCRDQSLYTGATNDPARRFDQHMRGKGAKYTRARGLKEIAFLAWMPSKSAALSAEAHLKHWPTLHKRALVERFDPIPWPPR